VQQRFTCVRFVCVLCVLAGCGRREEAPTPLTPQLSGTIEQFGLSAPVRVVRDRAGIPHIYAQNRDDLFFAQGYVQAQDRLFQMDLWRRSVQGRLAEVLGPNFAERDAMTRRIQTRVDPVAEWASYPPDAEAIARAFVRGINTYVALARIRRPEPFALAGWTPDLWFPADLLNRTDAFVAGGDALEEIVRARLIDALGASHAAAVLPGESLRDLPRGLDASAIGSVVGDAVRGVGAPAFLLALAGPVADAGAVRTQGDVPLDARLFEVPARRYLVHLNAPGWNVIGATLPWLPGVESGHNDRVGWTVEPIRADTQDVFVEKQNPANEHEVDENGRWVPTAIVKDRIRMRRRAEPFTFDREFTRHGVILAVDRARHLAFTVRWSGAEPGTATALIGLALDRAASSREIRTTIDAWRMPPRRVAYDDTAGDRGDAIAGRVPARRGWAGAVPAPGWTGANEWVGWERPRPPHSESAIERLARGPSDRLETLMRDLRRGAGDPRALILDAVADALRADHGPASPAIFAHVLGVTPAARRRFNIGPLTPAGGRGGPFALTFDRSDWDRTSAINAPGESESPDSAHYADLARVWAEGRSVALPFSERAVQADAETTLIMRPPPR
jgi:acyl-homoserine lactone acylase PvdQ